MLLTEVKTHDGEHRVYLSRLNSVVAFFEEDGDGNVIARVQPGEFACPYATTDTKMQDVRLCMPLETAKRLNVRPDQVELMSFLDIINVCDPPLQERHRWFGRTRAPVNSYR